MVQRHLKREVGYRIVLCPGLLVSVPVFATRRVTVLVHPASPLVFLAPITVVPLAVWSDVPVLAVLTARAVTASVLPFSKSNEIIFGYFDPENIFLDSKNE